MNNLAVGDQPLVSVLMITYNHEKYIAQAIESIVGQKTGFRFELVIGEDCSKDGTRNICERYAAAYPDVVRLLPTPHNFGMMPNLCRTMPACRGRYIAVCEGDDYWTEDLKLQTQIDLMESNPDVNLCFHVCREWSEADQAFRETRMFGRTQYGFRDFAGRGCFIHTCSILFRNLPEITGRFTEWTYSLSGGDYLIYLLCTQNGHKALAINKVMAVYRLHPGGSWTSLTNWRRTQLIENDLVIYHQNLRLNGREKSLLNFQLKRVILGYLNYYFSVKGPGKLKRGVIFLFNRIYFIFGPGRLSSFLALAVYPIIRKKATLAEGIKKELA
jgi:glycosyltransferase involved in cell wall biosynthesis